MPYSSNSELPSAAKKRLNSHQQTVFREAFNNALKEYNGNESKAYAVAWSAAKKA
jgi:cation transport regulator